MFFVADVRNEYIINDVVGMFQTFQSLAGPSVVVFADRTYPKWSSLVLVMSMGRSNGCQRLAVWVDGDLMISLECIELRKVLIVRGDCGDHFQRCRARVTLSHHVLVEMSQVDAESSVFLVFPQQYSDRSAPFGRTCCPFNYSLRFEEFEFVLHQRFQSLRHAWT